LVDFLTQKISKLNPKYYPLQSVTEERAIECAGDLEQV